MDKIVEIGDALDGLIGITDLGEATAKVSAVIQAAIAERDAQLVKWLRAPDQDGYSCVCGPKFADAIEAGDPWK